MYVDFTLIFSFFFFNDTATTEIYTLSLHDALPILSGSMSNQGTGTSGSGSQAPPTAPARPPRSSTPSSGTGTGTDRKSTRLNSSHANISYAVFCLKKKKNNIHSCGAQLSYRGVDTF